jgi:chromatin remodeling complex protein RSC6
MPAKKTSKTETEQVVAPAVIAAVVETAAPVVAEKKTRKTKTVDAAAAVVAAPVVVESAAPATENIELEVAVADQSVEFIAKLKQLGSMISALTAEYRVLEKKWSRDLKTANKQSSKRKRKAGNRAPSGFVKPTKISDELAKFLEKPTGSEMARTDVTREINTYIRAHKLQDKENGRKINPDTKLAALLKLKKTDELTYFNLQKYMSPHFAKNVKVEASTA